MTVNGNYRISLERIARVKQRISWWYYYATLRLQTHEVLIYIKKIHEKRIIMHVNLWLSVCLSTFVMGSNCAAYNVYISTT